MRTRPKSRQAIRRYSQQLVLENRATDEVRQRSPPCCIELTFTAPEDVGAMQS